MYFTSSRGRHFVPCIKCDTDRHLPTSRREYKSYERYCWHRNWDVLEVKSFVKNLISGCYNCIISCFTPRKDAIIMRLPDILCIKTKKTEFKNGTVTNIKVDRRDLSSIIFATNNINFQMRQRFVYIHFNSCDRWSFFWIFSQILHRGNFCIEI